MKDERTMKIIIDTSDAIDRIYRASADGQDYKDILEIRSEFWDHLGYGGPVCGFDLDSILELASDIGSKLSSSEDAQTIRQLKELTGVIIMRASDGKCDEED